MAAKKANKPKGIEEDIAKKILGLLRKGTPKAIKEADRLKGLQKIYRDDAAKMASGKNALSIEWSKKLGAERFAKERADNAKTATQRLREDSALRGMDSKFRRVGAKQSADETAAMTAARVRTERKKAFTESGGRNAPDRIDARKKAASNRAAKAKPPKKK